MVVKTLSGLRSGFAWKKEGRTQATKLVKPLRHSIGDRRFASSGSAIQQQNARRVGVGVVDPREYFLENGFPCALETLLLAVESSRSVRQIVEFSGGHCKLNVGAQKIKRDVNVLPILSICSAIRKTAISVLRAESRRNAAFRSWNFFSYSAILAFIAPPERKVLPARMTDNLIRMAPKWHGSGLTEALLLGIIADEVRAFSGLQGQQLDGTPMSLEHRHF
jgi:hypothetical protein